MGMFKAGISELAMIEAMIKPYACNGDAQIGRVGGIRQPHLARFIDLMKDYLLTGTMIGAPGADATLQRTASTRRQTRMAPLVDPLCGSIIENGDRA